MLDWRELKEKIKDYWPLVAFAILLCINLYLHLKFVLPRIKECESYGGYYNDNNCWALIEPIQLKGDLK